MRGQFNFYTMYFKSMGPLVTTWAVLSLQFITTPKQLVIFYIYKCFFGFFILNILYTNNRKDEIWIL